MHSCLRIPEILTSIFDCLCAEGDVGVVDTFTMQSLVLTCHYFHDVGIPILWKQIPTLLPLVLTIPQDFLSIEYNKRFSLKGRLTFICVAEETDWERFDFYASFVKQLGGIPNPMHRFVLDHECAYIFHARSLQRCLLPSLISAHVSSNDIPFLPSILSPNVRHVNIHLQAESDKTLVSLLPRITSLAPNLKTFSLGNEHAYTFISRQNDMCSAIQSFVLSLTELEDFRCDWYDMSDLGFFHLINLRNLKTLQFSKYYLPSIPATIAPFVPHSSTDDNSTIISPSPFRYLEHLGVASNHFSPGEIKRFFSRFHGLRLRSFRFTTYLAEPGQASDRDFYDAIHGLYNHLSRRHLTLLYLDVFIDHPDIYAEMQPFTPITQLFPNVTGYRTIEPLSTFFNLTDVRIQHYVIELGDEEFVQLGRSWPKLKQLVLNGNVGRGAVDQLGPDARRVTLDGLFEFAALCEDLEHLVMAIQCFSSAIPYEPEELGPTYRSRAGRSAVSGEKYVNTRFHTLSLGDSELDHVEDVRKLFQSAFPRLTSRSLSWTKKSTFSAKWDQIAEMLRKC